MIAPDDAPVTWHPTATHWGTYEAGVRDNRIVAMRPIAADPEPSDIGRSVIDALTGPTRVTAPMVRAGYLERGPVLAENRRGAEPFHEVSWEVALDLVAHELERVRDLYGPTAIYGGSYGWASAGRFHHAQSQVHRFLGQLGGYTPSVGSYSFHAMEVIVPYVLGESALDHLVNLPTWDEVAEHTELVVAFGGLPLKNSQVNPGGVFAHIAAGSQQRCREMGVHFVNISPVRGDVDGTLESEWYAPRPNTDAAVMLGSRIRSSRKGFRTTSSCSSAVRARSSFGAICLALMTMSRRMQSGRRRFLGWMPPSYAIWLAVSGRAARLLASVGRSSEPIMASTRTGRRLRLPRLPGR